MRGAVLLGVHVDAEGVFGGFVEEVQVFVMFSVLDCPKEGEFLRVFCDLAHFLVGEEGFAHFGEFALFAPATGFHVVVGVGEIEVGASFAAEAAIVDVFEELLDGFLVAGTFFVAVILSVNCHQVNLCTLRS